MVKKYSIKDCYLGCIAIHCDTVDQMKQVWEAAGGDPEWWTPNVKGRSDIEMFIYRWLNESDDKPFGFSPCGWVGDYRRTYYIDHFTAKDIVHFDEVSFNQVYDIYELW